MPRVWIVPWMMRCMMAKSADEIIMPHHILLVALAISLSMTRRIIISSMTGPIMHTPRNPEIVPANAWNCSSSLLG